MEPDREDDFFPKSTDLIHFTGDFPIGPKSAAHQTGGVQSLQQNCTSVLGRSATAAARGGARGRSGVCDAMEQGGESRSHACRRRRLLPWPGARALQSAAAAGIAAALPTAGARGLSLGRRAWEGR